MVLFHQLKLRSVPPAPSSQLLGSAPTHPTNINFRFTFIQDSVANKQDYVELGKSCAHVCQALNRGLNGRRLDELSQSILETIEELTT